MSASHASEYLFSLSVCGEPFGDESDLFVDEDDYREDLSIQQLPWMVSLGFFNQKWVHNCGGSLITKK